MDPVLTTVVLIFMVAYFGYLVLDWISTRRTKFIAWQIVCLIAAALYLHYALRFPIPRTSFGASGSVWTIAWMSPFLLLGMVSNHLFFNHKLSVKDCLRPFLVSPIVLMPLIPLVDHDSQLDSLRLISLCLISYQSGFFWKVLFQQIEATLGGRT